MIYYSKLSKKKCLKKAQALNISHNFRAKNKSFSKNLFIIKIEEI